MQRSVFASRPADLKDHVKSLEKQVKVTLRAMRSVQVFRKHHTLPGELFDDLLVKSREALEQLEAELERQMLR